MVKVKNTEIPRFKWSAFKCPHCHTIEAQRWEWPKMIQHKHDWTTYDLWYSTCENCNWRMLWAETYKTIYWWKSQQKVNVIFPVNYNWNFDFEISKDTPQIIEEDFKEAIQILPLSPRWACALLRLCLQKFLDEIVIKISWSRKDTIDESIKYLAIDVWLISDDISNIMHVLRIIGNEAVHPWQIDLKDDYQTAEELIELFNYLINELITENKKKVALYDKIPSSKKSAIKNNELIEKILEIKTINQSDDKPIFDDWSPLQDKMKSLL